MNRLGMIALISASASVGIASSAFGFVLGYSGGVYTQNFNTLPTSLPAGSTSLVGRFPHALNDAFEITTMPGWWGTNHRGSNSNSEFRAHDGSLAGASGRGVLSLGLVDDTERALGTLATSNQISSFGLILRNDTTDVIDEIGVEFFGEQWRRGDISSSAPTINSLTFAFNVFAQDPSEFAVNDIRLNPPAGSVIPEYRSMASLDFTSPNRQSSPTNVALDGNLAENRTFKSGTLGGLNWAPGTFLSLRWAGVDLTGQDDGLAIDDFRLIPSGPGTPEFVQGDFNFDGGLDGSDVDPFVLALSDLDTYLSDFAGTFAETYPGLTLDASVVDVIGDFNGDGGFDGSDVDGFVAALSGSRPGVASIPEPAAAGMLVPAVVGLLRRRR